MRRLVPLVVLVLAGCDAVEPWVSMREPPREPTDVVPCVRLVECAVLDELVAGPVSGEPTPPTPRCRDGLAPTTLDVSDDTRIVASSVACTELVIDVAPGETPVAITFEGDALEDARVVIRSASRPVDVQLAVSRVADATLEGEGPIAITAAEGGLERARIDAPDVRIEGGDHHDVVIAATTIRVRGAQIDRSRLDAEHVVLERGVLSDGIARAARGELIGADVLDATLEIAELAAGGGDWLRTALAPCRGALLSRVHLRSSRIGACEAPVELDDVQADLSVFHGDLEGESGYYAQCVFGGDTVELLSRIADSALCGVARVVANEVQCVRCEPESPPDVCGLVDGDTSFCPGICEAACDTGTLRFGGQACRQPDR
ncbi:hypothetical protein [Sandaracinus amylolyticus]|uniref:hypothetical protein n=1 Tax=Sandaracinus amylolyticus TaxID=927083 RepID=UPI001F26DE10|nr:hypothetical protein [Sandaracinus amylolyticus]UJR86337.1 Hypothetical protein I5071_84310 [Sandaracinus amylolyticus]